MDMVTVYAMTIANMFNAKDSGKPFSEAEYLYYQSCLDFMTEVNRIKTLDLRIQIERIENGQPPIGPKPKEDKDEDEEGIVPEGH
jgi:hypothetical protein